MKPGFSNKYTPPETIEEADADLAAILELAIQMAEASRKARPETANFVTHHMTLETILHHLRQADSMTKWMRFPHGEAPQPGPFIL